MFHQNSVFGRGNVVVVVVLTLTQRHIKVKSCASAKIRPRKACSYRNLRSFGWVRMIRSVFNIRESLEIDRRHVH